MCVCVRTSGDAASGHLPDDEAVAVHVGHDVSLEVVLVEALVQDLGSHVAPRPDPGAQGDVHLVSVAVANGKQELRQVTDTDGVGAERRFHRDASVRPPVELDGEAEVGDAAGAVLLDQDVLALQVAVGDGRLPLRAVDLRVQVAEAAGGGVRQPQQGRRVQRGQLQEVAQRAVLVVVGDEEELREGAGAFNVGRDEACRTERDEKKRVMDRSDLH